MIKIANDPKLVNDEKVNILRTAIEHRATWFYFLLDEVKKNGLDAEKLGRTAISRCGCFHGAEKIMKKCENPEDLRSFFKVFIDEVCMKAFEMEVKENTENKLYIDFYYCPLVAAWKKLNVDDDIPLLCDIAMEGDRGICSKFDGYKFSLGKLISKGDRYCELRIDKK